MKLRTIASTLMFLAALLAAAPPAAAVIKLNITVAGVYQGSKAVVTGTVAGVNAENGVIEIKVTETLKGKSLGERLRVQIAAPDLLKTEWINKVAAGAPMVLFLADLKAGGTAAIHLADTWLLANGAPNSNMQVWRVVQINEPTKQSFPGRTAALLRLLADLKNGKNTILDKFEQKVLAGGMRKLANLGVQKPQWIMAADVNGDKRAGLLVGTANGTRLFLATGDGYEDATQKWGLSGAAGRYHACGDVNSDGHLDLLLDGTLWLSDGQKFTAATTRFDPPDKSPLAAALLDVTGDGKPDALFLAADGQLRVFENPGAPEKPWPQRPAQSLWKDRPAPAMAAFGDWGDNGKPHVLVVWQTGIERFALDAAGGPPADFDRLTGLNLSKLSRYRTGLNSAVAVALDVNGDRRPDLLAVWDTGSLLLVNRGFGTYLCDDNAAPAVAAKGPTAAAGHSGAWTAASLRGDGFDDLLRLSDDGTLHAFDNRPEKKRGTGALSWGVISSRWPFLVDVVLGAWTPIRVPWPSGTPNPGFRMAGRAPHIGE
jgi:ribosomal protein L35AE/L33A